MTKVGTFWCAAYTPRVSGDVKPLPVGLSNPKEIGLSSGTKLCISAVDKCAKMNTGVLSCDNCVYLLGYESD